MKTGRIDVTKIDKAKLYKGKKGTYLDIVLHENKDGTDQYGNDGFIAQSVSKEEREAGVKGEILGNWKHVGDKRPAQGRPSSFQKPAIDPSLEPEEDDIPF